MNNFAINNLANMEYMLYGSRAGMNTSCPNYFNGYMSPVNNMNYFNPTFNGYNNYNNYNNYNKDVFTQANDATTVNNPYQTAAEGSSQVDWNNPQFKGLTNEDMNKLADYYAKNNVLEEGFLGAATGGLSWMAFEHAQSVFHPINAYKGMGKVKEVFKDMPKEFAAKNATLVEHAQIATQQAYRDTLKKWWPGLLRKQLDVNAIQPYLDEMKAAAKAGDIEGMARATEHLQAARGMDGKIARIFSKAKTVAERIDKKRASGAIEKNKKALIAMNENVIKNKFGSLVVNSLKKDFVGFMAFEALFNAGKIMTAFNKDAKTGVEQTVQSAGKSALGAAGWCVGRAAGTWLGAKAGAAIGTAICPGAGTAIGALIGLTVGSIGMWAGHKLGNKLLGTDVADKLEAQNLAKTAEGQTELLRFAMQKAQEGKTDAGTNQIVYKALVANA